MHRRTANDCACYSSLQRGARQTIPLDAIVKAAGPRSYAETRSMRACSLTLIVATLLVFTMSSAVADEQQPKRVLVFHSFGPDFGDLYSEKLRTELDLKMPGRLDLYEEWLVSARFSTPHEDTALVNYLRGLFADHPLDLIITLGAPARTRSSGRSGGAPSWIRRSPGRGKRRSCLREFACHGRWDPSGAPADHQSCCRDW
jgi:hypothetical protein